MPKPRVPHFSPQLREVGCRGAQKKHREPKHCRDQTKMYGGSTKKPRVPHPSRPVRRVGLVSQRPPAQQTQSPPPPPANPQQHCHSEPGQRPGEEPAVCQQTEPQPPAKPPAAPATNSPTPAPKPAASPPSPCVPTNAPPPPPPSPPPKQSSKYLPRIKKNPGHSEPGRSPGEESTVLVSTAKIHRCRSIYRHPNGYVTIVRSDKTTADQ